MSTGSNNDDGEVSKERWSYEYYDYQQQRGDNLLLAEKGWAEDVCYDTAFSILFFILVTLIGLSFGVYSVVLYFKRRNKLYYGFDILYTFLFIAAFIK